MSLGPQASRLAAAGRHKGFSFMTGNLVLVKWEDGMVYFAKIKRIDRKREKCTVVFDDKSQDEADFCQIHSVDETTTDIICIKCKKDNSDSPNEIVLCDMCGIGFHQKCHTPPIPASALQLDIPWMCSYCQRGVKCPFITESLDVLQNLLSDDNETTTGDEGDGPVESEYDELAKEESSPSRQRKRKYRKRHYSRSAMLERRKSLRLYTNGPEVSSLVTSERKSHALAHDSGEDKDEFCTPKIKAQTLTNDSTSGSERTDGSSGRKRKRHHCLTLQKKLKRSSVESRTVSVTRIDTPIYEEGCVDFLSALSPKNDSIREERSPGFTVTDSESAVTEKSCIDDGASSGMDISSGLQSDSPTKEKPVKVKQRRFRVSLSLSGEQKSGIKSPNSIPSWDDIPGSSPPKNSKRSPSFESDSCFHSPGSSIQNSAVPFLAPLPTTGKKQPTVDSRIQTNSPGSKVMELMVSVSSPASVNRTGSKTLECSHHKSMPNSHSGTSVIGTASMELSETTSNTAVSCSGTTEHSALVIASGVGIAAGSGNPASLDSVVASGVGVAAGSCNPASLDSVVIASGVGVAAGSCNPASLDSGVAGGDDVSPASPDAKVSGTMDVEVTRQTSPVTIASFAPSNLQMDVGVTGSCGHLRSSPKSTNPVVVGTIAVCTSDRSEGMDSTTAKEPAPMSVQLPVHPMATSQPSQTDFTDKGASSRDRSCEKSTVSVVEPSVRPIAVQTKPPAASHVPVNTASSAAKVSPSTTSPQKKHRFKLVRGMLPVRTSHKEEQPAGAPTPVITKTPPQNRGHLPEQPRQQMAKSDKLATNEIKEHLPQAESTQAAVSRLGGAGDPDVIITGVEPSVEEQPRTNNAETTTTNSPGTQQQSSPLHAGTKQIGAKQVPSPPLHAGDSPPARSEKPSYYYQVQSMVPRPEKAGPHVDQLHHHNMENRHIPPPARTVANTVHVLYSADPAPRPVTHHSDLSIAPKYHHGTGTRLYHTPVRSDAGLVGHHPSSVVTTKPYAIVNAIPAQPLPDIGYRSIPLPQKPSAGGGPSGHCVMQIVPATGSTAAQQLVSESPNQQSGYRISSSAPSPPLPPPPSYSTYIAGKKEKVSDKDVKSIQKKIGDAFTQSSEVMLVSAFEEAWKKFQDNDEVYKRRPTVSLHKNKVTFSPASDAVVVTTSQENLVQQMSTKPQVIAPKPLPENVQMLPATSQGHQYIRIGPPNVTPQQLLIQQIPTEYTNVYTIPTATPPGNQVRVAGLYYPSASVDRTDQSDSHKVVVAKKPPTTNSQSSVLQRAVVQERPRPRLADHGTSRPKMATKGTPPAAGPRPGAGSTSANKQHKKKCAWCGGGAIYLCSGCHQEWYCGSECQLKSWELHSDHCKA